MKTKLLVLLVVLSAVALCAGRAISEETSPVAATGFPYETVAENYVPSLYYAPEPASDERLVAVADFPASTWDSCYCPSLYYEAWKIKAMQAMSRP